MSLAIQTKPLDIHLRIKQKGTGEPNRNDIAVPRLKQFLFLIGVLAFKETLYIERLDLDVNIGEGSTNQFFFAIPQHGENGFVRRSNQTIGRYHNQTFSNAINDVFCFAGLRQLGQHLLELSAKRRKRSWQPRFGGRAAACSTCR